MQKTFSQAYTVMLASSLTISDNAPGFGKVPSANLVISHMKGPTAQLYLAGAPMVAFHGLPILPPSAGVNVTFASVNTTICLAVGVAPEAVHKPSRLAELIAEALGQLQIDTGTKVAKTTTVAKTTPDSENS